MGVYAGEATARVPSYLLSIVFLAFSTLTSASPDSLSKHGLGRPVAAGVHDKTERVKGAYWPSYDPTLIRPEAIGATLFTHVYYAFAAVEEPTFAVVPSADHDALLLENFTAILRAANPSVKTLISIGGAAADSAAMSTLAADPALRRTFCQTSIQLARNYSFDGLDLDWEFPQSANDMGHMAALLGEWRRAVDSEASLSGRPPLLLTAAVYYNVSVRGFRYPVENLTESVDWLNIMCFDYHGRWENVTGEHSALFDAESDYNTDYGVSNWLRLGLPPHKAVLGIPMYGRSWTLLNESDAAVGAPARDVGPGQHVSNQPGIFYYSEIREFVLTRNATDRIDDGRVSAYCHAGDVWVGYENPRTVSERVKYLANRQMRGYFFWALGFDPSWTLSEVASVTFNHAPLDRNVTAGSSNGIHVERSKLPLNVWWPLLTTIFFVGYYK